MKRIQRTAAVALSGLLLATGVVGTASATDSTPTAATKQCRDTVRKAAKAQKVAVKTVTQATADYNAAVAVYNSHDNTVVMELKAARTAYRALLKARQAARVAINYTFNCAVRAAVKTRTAAVAAAGTDTAKVDAAQTAFNTAVAAARKAKQDAINALAPLPQQPAGLKHGKPNHQGKPTQSPQP